MRAYGSPPRGPSWIVGVLVFGVLLLLLQLARGSTPAARPLSQQFAAQPPSSAGGKIVLPPLPSSVAGLARTAMARISRGATGTALTPVAQSAELRVEISGIQRTPQGLHIAGAVTNIGGRPLPVSLEAFRFTDGSGTVYAADNATATTLAPGQRAPLDLTLPITDLRQLTLDVQPDTGPAIHMVLIQAP